MPANEHDPGSDWYRDAGTLLGELQRTRITSSRVPSIDGYAAFEEIDRGGQGEVYSAHHEAMNRRVAIKVLLDRAFASEVSRLRFEREIDLVASLEHPNIVRIYDRGVTDGGRQYFSMEHIDGVPLRAYMASGSHDVRSILSLFVRICAAVSFAHQRGIIHRDLKPNNILVDASGQPRLLDFGLAKELAPGVAEGVTATGEFAGTLAYASPEQLSGDANNIDVRTDVFALGVILYEMLTDTRPFDTSIPVAEAIRAILEQTPTAPSRVPTARGLIGEIDTIVLKALAKAPERRYQSASEFQEDVERFLRGDPIGAQRDSGWYLLRKTVKRHPVAAAAIGFALLAVAGTAAGMSVLYGHAERERAKAEAIRIFLEDTLGDVEPRVEGREVTVAEALGKAVQWLAILSTEPEVAASVRTTIGNSYRALGHLEQAEVQLEAALAERQTLFGEDHVQVASSLNALGLLRRDQGDYPEAHRLFSEALSIHMRHSGSQSRPVAQVRQSLAVLAKREGKFDEAESLFRESLAIRRDLLGESHPDVAMCHYQLGQLFEQSGEADAALREHQLALNKRKQSEPESHPSIADSLLAVGRLQAADGKLAEAQDSLRDCLKIRTEILPPDHWRIAEAQSALATCLASTDQTEEAVLLLRQATAILVNARGPGDQLTQATQRQLAEIDPQP